MRLSAEQDNLLAAWSWAIDTGNVDTAFSILAGFAPSEVSSRWPLVLDGEAALELPGAAAHPGYPLALAVSARFASHRARCDRHRGTVPRAPPRPTNAAIPTTGGSRKSSATPAQTSRLLPARSPTPPASPSGPLVLRGPVATSPTPPSSSASPRAVTCLSVTRPGRSRWPARRSRWPGRSAIRRSSPAACSPSA